MNIKEIRLLAELSQKEFGAKYNIPLKTLQNWEATQGSSSARSCPRYVESLLEKAIRTDYPNKIRLLASNMDERHLKALFEAKKKIVRSPLSPYVEDLILYGSTARGMAKPSSDVDILLVLKEDVRLKKKCNDWIISLKGNISSDDFTIPEADLHVTFGNAWETSEDVFFHNIRKEGFSVWN